MDTEGRKYILLFGLSEIGNTVLKFLILLDCHQYIREKIIHGKMEVQDLRTNSVERRNFLAPSLRFDDQKFEFIFVLDRSGSMSGHKMTLANRALELFLRSLPTTCVFNVIGFGSTFVKLYADSVAYNQQNLDDATRYARSVTADLSGTKLIPPLNEIYNSTHQDGFLKQIFVLTDGQNEEGAATAIQLVASNKGFARVFSLGIGSDADRQLIEGIASEGGGVAEYVQPSTEKIETKVLDQLKIALRPSLLKAVPLNVSS